MASPPPAPAPAALPEPLLDVRDAAALTAIGGGRLRRPECVLAHESGLVIVPHWEEGGGGIAVLQLPVDPGQPQHPGDTPATPAPAAGAGAGPSGGVLGTVLGRGFAGADGEPLRPNGIALEEGGTVLLAHLGPTRGGVYRLYPDGRTEAVVVATADGEPLPPTNFAVVEGGRLWLTVSTRECPRSRDYRAGAASGFVAVVEPCPRPGDQPQPARIVADGLGYTNELVLLNGGRTLAVNETFGQRLTLFDVVVSDGDHGDAGDGGSAGGVGLRNRRVAVDFAEPALGLAGAFPDGLAATADGGLLCTFIIANTVVRIDPAAGTITHVVVAEALEHARAAEAAFRVGELGRPHLDRCPGSRLGNVSSVAFAGPGLDCLVFGTLLGRDLLTAPAPATCGPGLAPAHFSRDVAPLRAALASQVQVG